MQEQGFLFAGGAEDDVRAAALRRVGAADATAEDRALATRLPAAARFGTSSYAFAGWRGVVYERTAAATALARDGLVAYASHPLLRTVALDRAFYAPIPVDEGRRLASLVPTDFRFLVKAHQSITRPDRDANGGTFGDTARLRREGDANPDFLDAARAADLVVFPLLDAFGARLGPILFQFPPLLLDRTGRVGDAEALVERLDRFLGALPVGPAYAVEFRNRALFEGPVAVRAAATLRAHGVAWSLAVHPSLPHLSAQGALLSRLAPDDGSPLVIRWLLGHGLGYDEAKSRYEPFDRLVDEDEASRRSIARLVVAALRRRRDAWVIVNNKAEGSAPLSIRRLAAATVAASSENDDSEER
jgi:uncharacterized protein YecE (DUF72 family)